MIPSLDAMLDAVIRREGGFVNHPADRGGATNFGITQATLAAYRGHAVTVDDVRLLTEAEARNIYRNDYLSGPQLHRIRDPYLVSLMFDSAIQHGPPRAIRWLQQALGVTDDGVFGDVTEVACNSVDPVRLYQKVLAARIRFYGRLVSQDPELARAGAAGYRLQAVFCSGWLNRAAEFVEV